MGGGPAEVPGCGEIPAGCARRWPVMPASGWCSDADHVWRTLVHTPWVAVVTAAREVAAQAQRYSVFVRRPPKRGEHELSTTPGPPGRRRSPTAGESACGSGARD